MITRVFKITIAVLAILLLGIIGGFATTVMAEVPQNTAVITMENDAILNITPEGYSVGGNDFVEHTGGYLIMGEANTNIDFANGTSEQVTYDVILHEFHAVSQEWHGCVGIDTGVTLNLTVYGENSFLAYNHGGIVVNNLGNSLEAILNITVMENSALTVGSRYWDTPNCMTGDLNITLLQGSSDLDMSVDGWQNVNKKVCFSNGTLENHKCNYETMDDEYCKMYCDYCDIISVSVLHDIDIFALDDDYHKNGCTRCEYGETAPHTLTNAPNGDTHVLKCSVCSFNTEAEEEHSFENKVCTGCGLEAVLKHTDEANNVKYFSFGAGIDYAIVNGGTLQLLRDYDAGGSSIGTYDADSSYTFDLNGHTFDNSHIYVYEGCITVIDTSEEKTGFFADNDSLNMSYYGTIIVDGANIESMFAVNSEEALIIIKNVNQSTLSVCAWNGGKIQIINAVITDYFQIYMDGVNTDSYTIQGGSFNKIYLFNYFEDSFTLFDFLADGYAFSQNGEIVNGMVISLENVSVVEHTHDFENVAYNYSSDYHWTACACGEDAENAIKEEHKMDENGLCSVCQQKIVAAVTQYDEGTTKYFLDIHQALENVQSLEKSKLTLYSDAETDYVYYIRENREITIDLNGYTLLTSEHLDIGYGTTLIIEDTSKEQNGAISGGRPNYSVLSVRGKLVFNSGRLLSVINALGSEGEASEIIINDGTFEGITLIILYNYSNAVINGGTFKVDRIISIYDEPISSSVKIYGGIFETGLTINDDSNSLFIDDLLPQLDGCEITLVNKDGEPIELTENQASYNEYVRVKHENEAINTDGESHTFYCDTCSLTYASEKHRDYSYNLDKNNNDIHIAVCGVCEYELEGEEHSGGKATCIAQAICEYCEAEYGQIDDVNGHNGGEATCINKAVCTLCQKEYGNLNKNNHETVEYEYTQGKNADEHNKVYACCGGIIDTGKHENGVADCTSKAVCTVCGFEYGNAPSGHKYSNNCDASCNVCGEGRQINGHVYDNACDTECNECKATRQITHTYGADGKCLTCDATTECQNEPSKNMGAGAIIGIILATVAVFGGGAFSLIWFVLRKKF